MQKTPQSTTIRNAIMDIARSLTGVFKRYSLDTRNTAWRRITSDRGEKEVKKILINPSRQIDTLFPKLQFKEWIIKEWEAEMSLTTLARETYRRQISNAINELKRVAPEVFNMDSTTGTPAKITASFELLASKLRDRGLIPSGTDEARFTANVKSFFNRPVEESDLMFLNPRGEGPSPDDYRKVQESRHKYWGVYKNKR